VRISIQVHCVLSRTSTRNRIRWRSTLYVLCRGILLWIQERFLFARSERCGGLAGNSIKKIAQRELLTFGEMAMCALQCHSERRVTELNDDYHTNAQDILNLYDNAITDLKDSE